LLIVGTVQGLVKEKKKVRDAFRNIEPDVVALPISEEMLEGLKAVVAGEVMEVATNSIDDLFADHLKRFGEVQLPPPSLVEAYRIADEKGVDIVTLDMGEEEYADEYVKNVTGMHFWRRIWSLSKLSKKTFVADTPEEFVVMWDDYVTRFKGYADLEKTRERYMARNAAKLLKDHEKVLVLVEYERLSGVLDAIEEAVEDVMKKMDSEDEPASEEELPDDPGSDEDGGGEEEGTEDDLVTNEE